jgi:hypothetical protein
MCEKTFIAVIIAIMESIKVRRNCLLDGLHCETYTAAITIWKYELMLHGTDADEIDCNS